MVSSEARTATFFRARSFCLTLQRGRQKLRIPVQVQVEYCRFIDPLTGMTVNLLDVDRWLNHVLQRKSEAANMIDWMNSVANELAKLSKFFQALEVQVSQSRIKWKNSQIRFTYFGTVWINQNDYLEKLPLELQSSKALRPDWLKRYLNRRWSSSEKLAELSLKKFPFIESLKIQSLPQGETAPFSVSVFRRS